MGALASKACSACFFPPGARRIFGIGGFGSVVLLGRVSLALTICHVLLCLFGPTVLWRARMGVAILNIRGRHVVICKTSMGRQRAQATKATSHKSTTAPQDEILCRQIETHDQIPRSQEQLSFGLQDLTTPASLIHKSPPRTKHFLCGIQSIVMRSGPQSTIL